MSNKEELEKKINQTLNSLEGLGKAEASPFFYTRLEAKMEQQLLPASSSLTFLGEFRWSVAALSLFMIMNITSLFFLTGTDTASEEASLETFSQEYFSGTDESSYFNDL